MTTIERPGADEYEPYYAIGLDAAIVRAYVALLSPLVSSSVPRLLLLGLLALVANLIVVAPGMDPASPAGAGAGLLVSPVTAGFALVLGREPAAAAPVLTLQALCPAALLGAAVWLFRRRDLAFVQ